MCICQSCYSSSSLLCYLSCHMLSLSQYFYVSFSFLFFPYLPWKTFPLTTFNEFHHALPFIIVLEWAFPIIVTPFSIVRILSSFSFIIFVPYFILLSAAVTEMEPQLDTPILKDHNFPGRTVWPACNVTRRCSSPCKLLKFIGLVIILKPGGQLSYNADTRYNCGKFTGKYVLLW